MALVFQRRSDGEILTAEQLNSYLEGIEDTAARIDELENNIAMVHVGDEEPAEPTVGMLWFDTDEPSPEFDSPTIHADDTPPPAPSVGDFWYDPTGADEPVLTEDSLVVQEFQQVADRVGPLNVGEESQGLMIGPHGPQYTDQFISLDWYSNPNDAIAIAKARGVKAVGRGDYAITDTVLIDTDVDFSGATFTVNDPDAVAVRVGSDSATINDLLVHLPRIVQASKPSASGGWSGTSVGLELRNLARSIIYVPEVKHFSTGILSTANGGRGNVHNQVFLGFSNNNKVHIQLFAADTSWVNEMLWFGGLLYNSSLEGIAVAGARKILMSADQYTPNGNRFYGMTIGNGPTDDVHEYLVDCYGSDNSLYHCRWEAPEGHRKVLWNTWAVRNHIDGGPGAGTLEFVETGNSRYNTLKSPTRTVFDGLSDQASVQFVSNWNSTTQPAVTMIRAQNGVLAADPNQYTWGLARDRSYYKGWGDAIERLSIQHTTGELAWGSGGAAVDTHLGRKAASVLGTGANDGFRTGVFTTTTRPSASAMGEGTQIFDSDLNKPLWSDGTSWRDATGTVV